jgi:DNA uptake protein ComE-like DNA-binding protein
MARKSDAQPGDYVELADKDGGFYDSETELNISRGQQVQLGDRIGKRTQEALVSGGLLVVSGKPKTAEKKAENTESDLPEGIPGREAFIAAGMNFDKVMNFDFEKDKVPGIGAKTVEALTAYLKPAV